MNRLVFNCFFLCVVAMSMPTDAQTYVTSPEVGGWKSHISTLCAEGRKSVPNGGREQRPDEEG